MNGKYNPLLLIADSNMALEQIFETYTTVLWKFSVILPTTYHVQRGRTSCGCMCQLYVGVFLIRVTVKPVLKTTCG